MNSMADNASAGVAVELATMPRFEDGGANLREPIRQMAGSPVNETMGAEADQPCGATGNSGNGHGERRPVTCVGTPAPRMPKPRVGSFFPGNVPERHRRVDRATVAAVAETCATGASARKVRKAAKAMGVERLSRDRAGTIAQGLDAEVGELPEGPPGERANREIKRRSKVVQVFPSAESLERLAGAVMCGRDEGRRASRHFSEEKTAGLDDGHAKVAAKTPPSTDRSTELWLVERKATETSLELADKLEAA